MKPWKILKVVGSDNSKLHKQDVISQHIDNDEFVKGIQTALDPMTTFGVAKVPSCDEGGKGITPVQFYTLAEKLQVRDLTGHAARDAIQELCDKAFPEQWNGWYRRILLKDLKSGFSSSTVNKVRKKTIPLFEVMLAHDGLKKPKKMVGKCLIENKYDGVRAIVIVEDNIATIYSRNGKELKNFPHINEAMSDEIYNGYMFDSEVMSTDFQALMKQVQRKTNVETSDSFLALFDVLPLDEFKAGVGTMDALERKALLEEWEYDSCVSVVDYTEVDLDTDEGQATFKEMNRVALENGYEGLMIKPVHMPYVCKRSDAWLKVKPFIEVTLKVIDIEEGKPDSKYVGNTGALVCAGTDDGKYFEVNVGSGLSDKQRKDIWKSKDDVVGQLIEIRADDATLSEGNDDVYSLRFPRFKTFRGFDKGEKI